MGILDDAIREHLELKRKHGVPEEEVERQEEEALGPARREVAQQPEDAEIAAEQGTPAAATEDGAPSAVDDTARFDGEHAGAAALEDSHAAEHEPALAEPPADDLSADELSAEEPPADEPPLAEPPVADHTGLEPAPLDDAQPAEPPDLDEPDEPDEPDDPDAEPDPHAALGDTEPHGFPAVEDDEDDEDDPDLLEDTPDFLQETPEHDRLWFEQKPPRDFDFD